MVSYCATFTKEYYRVIAYFPLGGNTLMKDCRDFLHLFMNCELDLKERNVGKHEWLYCKSFFVLYVKAADVRRRESLNLTTLNGYCRKMHCFLKTTVCFGKSWCYPLKCEVLKQLKQFTSQTFKSDLWIIKFILSWIMPA